MSKKAKPKTNKETTMYTVIEIENEKWQIKGIAIKAIIEQ
jgi:hypothetical protein